MPETPVCHRILKDPRSRANDLKVLRALAFSRDLTKYDVAKRILNKEKLAPNDLPGVSVLSRRVDDLCKKDFVQRKKGETAIRKDETDVFELTQRGFYAAFLCDSSLLNDWRTVAKNYPEYYGRTSLDKAIFEYGTDRVFWFFNIKPYHDLIMSKRIDFNIKWDLIEDEVSIQLQNQLENVIDAVKGRKASGDVLKLSDFKRQDVEALVSILGKREVCEYAAGHLKSMREKMITRADDLKTIESELLEMPELVRRSSLLKAFPK